MMLKVGIRPALARASAASVGEIGGRREARATGTTQATAIPAVTRATPPPNRL
jgi:hypothetical protein